MAVLSAWALAGGISGWGATAAPSATEGIQEALSALARNDPRQAEHIAARLAASNAQGAQRAWLIAATARRRLGSYDQAADAYRKFLAGCDDPRERGYGLEQIGECMSSGSRAPRPAAASQLLTAEQRRRLSFVEGRHSRQIHTTDHFVVRAYNSELAKLIGRQAEAALAHICQVILCGQDYPHTVSVYVWPNVSEYHKHAASAPEWAGGAFTLKHDPTGRILRRIDLTQLDDKQQFDLTTLDRVLPHEICHLVLAEYFGDAHCPLAVNEGLAMMAEATVANGRVRLAGAALAGTRKIPLRKLLTTTRLEPDDAHIFYAEAWSLTSYVHARLSRKQFREMLAHLKAGCPFEEALQRALYLPPDENFLAGLAKAWESEAIRQGQFLQALDSDLTDVR